MWQQWLIKWFIFHIKYRIIPHISFIIKSMTKSDKMWQNATLLNSSENILVSLDCVITTKYKSASIDCVINYAALAWKSFFFSSSFKWRSLMRLILFNWLWSGDFIVPLGQLLAKISRSDSHPFTTYRITKSNKVQYRHRSSRRHSITTTNPPLKSIDCEFIDTKSVEDFGLI